MRGTDSFSVGIKTIDEEHKDLLRQINNLQSAVRYSTGVKIEWQALAEWVGYTKVQFAREVELMKKHEYPGYDEHKRQHADMAARTKKMVKWGLSGGGRHGRRFDMLERLDAKPHKRHGSYSAFVTGKGLTSVQSAEVTREMGPAIS